MSGVSGDMTGEDVRRPEPGEVYEWTDSADLNQFQWRRLDSGNFLVILGHGPHDHRRTFVSVVLPYDVASDFAATLVEHLSEQFGRDVTATEGEVGLVWKPEDGARHVGCPYYAAVFETDGGPVWFCNKCGWGMPVPREATDG